jgi:hypothetical protein
MAPTSVGAFFGIALGDGSAIANATLVNLLKINNIRTAAPSRGLHLFWEPFWRKSVSPGSDADGQT